jgi:hypothetical protein
VLSRNDFCGFQSIPQSVRAGGGWMAAA